MWFFRRGEKARKKLDRLLDPGFRGDWRKVLRECAGAVEETWVRRVFDEGIGNIRRNDLGEAIRLLRIAAEASRGSRDLLLRGKIARWLGNALTRRMATLSGEKGPLLQEAIGALDDALTYYRSVGRSRVLAQIWRDKAIALRCAGLPEESVQAYDEAVKLIDRHGLPPDEPGILQVCMNGRAEAVEAQRIRLETTEIIRLKGSSLRREGKVTQLLELHLRRGRELRGRKRYSEAAKVLREAAEEYRAGGGAREVGIQVLSELAEVLLEDAETRTGPTRLARKAEAAEVIEELNRLVRPREEGTDGILVDARRILQTLIGTSPELPLDEGRIVELLRAGPQPDPAVARQIEEIEERLMKAGPSPDSVSVDAARAAQLTILGWSKIDILEEGRSIALEAANVFLEAMMLDPTRPEAWSGFSLAEMEFARTREGRFPPRIILTALPHALLAVKLGPWSQAARYVLGLAYLRLGMLAEGRKEVEELARIAPRSYMAMELRRAWLAAQGSKQKAIALRQEILPIAPTPELRRRHLHGLAIELFEEGDSARAERAFRSLTGDFPHYAPGWHDFSRFLYREGRFQEALEASDRALGLAELPEARELNEKLRRRLRA